MTTPETKKKKVKNKELAMLNAGEVTEDFIVRCEQHLEGHHHVLWGQAFDIKDPTRRRKAAEWLASEIVSLMIDPAKRTETK